MQDNRHLKLAKLHKVQKKEPQLVDPGAKYLAFVSSWTLRPPRNAAGPSLSAIGVILHGQFYIYQACAWRGSRRRTMSWGLRTRWGHRDDWDNFLSRLLFHRCRDACKVKLALPGQQAEGRHNLLGETCPLRSEFSPANVDRLTPTLSGSELRG